MKLLLQLAIAAVVLGAMLFGVGALAGLEWLTPLRSLAIPAAVFVGMLVVRVARFEWNAAVLE